MQDHCTKIETAKRAARYIFHVGMKAERPLSQSHAVAATMLAENGFRVPDDLLDFASDGRLSDFNVRDWAKPHDIVEKRRMTTENIWEMV